MSKFIQFVHPSHINMFKNGKSLYRKQPVQPEVLLRSVAVVDLPHADHHGRNPLQVNISSHWSKLSILSSHWSELSILASDWSSFLERRGDQKL